MFQAGKRRLGRNGPEVSAIGLGCMGMSEFYGAGDETESIARSTMRSISESISSTPPICTASARTRSWSARAIRAAATRCSSRRSSATSAARRASSSAFAAIPNMSARRCEASLKRLGVEVIDLYYQHRVDPDVPIEDTVGEMAGSRSEGKVRISAFPKPRRETIRAGDATSPITARPDRVSLWSRDAEAEVLPTMRELGIGFVAYSPLGRGFLTGQIKSPDDFADDDFRKFHPRFQGENFERNIAARPRGRGDGQRRKAAPPPSWRSPGCSPRATTSCRSRAPSTANISTRISARSTVTLTAADLARLDQILPPGAASGEALSRTRDGGGQPLAPLVDQAHAGDSGLGFLKFRYVDLGDVEAAFCRAPRRCVDWRLAGSAFRRPAGNWRRPAPASSTAIGSTPANCAGSTQRGLNNRTGVPLPSWPARVAPGLEVQAIAQPGLGPRDSRAARRCGRVRRSRQRRCG